MLSGKWPAWKSSNLYSGLYWPVVTKPYACLADVFQNFPEYLQGFQSLPNFSIYEADAYFLGTVIFAVSCGIFAFLVLCIVIANIFRMLSLLKTQISASNYQKHRAAVWSLLAQFATSGVCFIPPLALVFVALFSINRGQCRFISVIVEYLLVIACSHSSLNVLVLIATFPPYRKYVLSLVKRKKWVKTQKTRSIFVIFQKNRENRIVSAFPEAFPNELNLTSILKSFFSPLKSDTGFKIKVQKSERA